MRLFKKAFVILLCIIMVIVSSACALLDRIFTFEQTFNYDLLKQNLLKVEFFEMVIPIGGVTATQRVTLLTLNEEEIEYAITQIDSITFVCLHVLGDPKSHECNGLRFVYADAEMVFYPYQIYTFGERLWNKKLNARYVIRETPDLNNLFEYFNQKVIK